MGLVLALLAAAANALATVLQRIGVEDAAGDRQVKGLLVSVLRRPVWFAGLALAGASFLLQSMALSLGDLSTIQPIMVTELLFLLVILSVWFHQALGWKEWLGALGTALGLGLFLATGSAGGGHSRPSPAAWVFLLIASAGALIVSVVAAQRGPRWWRASAYGFGGGIAFALTAAFIKTAADQWSRGPLVTLSHWQAYSVAGAGLVGLVLSQHALEAGPVAASQSALLVVNPLSSIVMGVWLFGDHLHVAGGRLEIEAVGLFCMFVSLFLLASSPLVSASTQEELLTRPQGFAPLEERGCAG
jgi:drug/metabolite transporter (DMT)-like permease